MGEIVDRETFLDKLGEFLIGKNEDFQKKIKSFLLDFIDEFEPDEIKVKMSLNSTDNGLVGFEVVVTPIEVRADVNKHGETRDYVAEKCCVAFDASGTIFLTSCRSEFDVHNYNKLHYDMRVEGMEYDACGIMLSRHFRKRKYLLCELPEEAIIPDYSSMKVFGEFESNPIRVKLDYEKLFSIGLEMLVDAKQGVLDRAITLVADCERKSHDVAHLYIFKHIFTVPSVFDAYFMLDDNNVVDLPDISFPLWLNHGEYQLDFLVKPKSSEDCLTDLENLKISGKIDASQCKYLLGLALASGRDTFSYVDYSYGPTSITRYSNHR